MPMRLAYCRSPGGFSLRPAGGKHRLFGGSTAKQSMIRKAAGLILFTTLALGGAHAQDHLPIEPEAYRNDNYRAPTPRSLRGARTVSITEAEAIWRTGDRKSTRLNSSHLGISY